MARHLQYNLRAERERMCNKVHVGSSAGKYSDPLMLRWLNGLLCSPGMNSMSNEALMATFTCCLIWDSTGSDMVRGPCSSFTSTFCMSDAVNQNRICDGTSPATCD